MPIIGVVFSRSKLSSHSARSKMRKCYFQQKWMELEDTVLSETSQTQKGKSNIFSLTCEN